MVGIKSWSPSGQNDSISCFLFFVSSSSFFFPPELPSYSSPIAIMKISPEVHGKPVSFQAEEILPSFSSEIACLGGMIERNER